jgi:hypothetical protein
MHIIATWNKDTEEINIYNCGLSDGNIIFEKVKTYSIKNACDLSFGYDDKLWLFICDNLNLKLYCYTNKQWEKNYRILYHNNAKLTNIITKLDVNNKLIIMLKDESDNNMCFRINEEMYRLDLV